MNVREAYNAIQAGNQKDTQQALFGLLHQVQVLATAVLELAGDGKLKTGNDPLSFSTRLNLSEFLGLPKRRTAMSEQFEVEEPESGLESIGPFNQYKLTLDGYRIPNLEGRQLPSGNWYLALSNSCSIEVPDLYGKGVAWMIANAMAIGAGYTCFGEGAKPLNPFKTRLIHLNTDSVEMSDCDDGPTTISEVQ